MGTTRRPPTRDSLFVAGVHLEPEALEIADRREPDAAGRAWAPGPAARGIVRAPARIATAARELEPAAVEAPQAHPSLHECAETFEHRTEPS